MVRVMPSKATCKNASGSLTGPISGRVPRRSAGNDGITRSILYSVFRRDVHRDIVGSRPARVKAGRERLLRIQKELSRQAWRGQPAGEKCRTPRAFRESKAI